MNNISHKKYLFVGIIFILFLIINQNILAEETDSLNVADNESVKIDSIRITGNAVTQEFIILRELTIREGDVVTGKFLRFNRERVYSLRLFNRVDFLIHNEQNKNILEIRLKESWYLYPLPYFRTFNSDIKKATYGVNLSYKNFRGRNETIRALIGLGYDPTYSISYDNPALIFESDIGLSFSFSYSKITNKNLIAENIIGQEFQYKTFSQNISVSKRINQFNTGFLSLAYNYLETDYAVKEITASGARIDRVISAGLTYIYDSRDLKQYSQNGLYTYFGFTHNGFGINNISYNNIDFDFREYRSILEPLSGKWRIALRSAFGESVPFYNYSYLGYQERVRGHSGEIREGKSYLLTSFELSYPILREWNVSLKLPLLPESLTSARIGIFLTSFIDAGDTFNGKDSFAVNHFYSGYGFGITILFLPYNAFRIEYALNELGKGEVVIGTGFSF